MIARNRTSIREEGELGSGGRNGEMGGQSRLLASEQQLPDKAGESDGAATIPKKEPPGCGRETLAPISPATSPGGAGEQDALLVARRRRSGLPHFRRRGKWDTPFADH